MATYHLRQHNSRWNGGLAMISSQTTGRMLALALLAGATFAVSSVSSGPAHAAGGAFAVDDSEVAKPGECKVESWYSHASNDDLVAVASPACVVKLGLPVELGFALARSRGDDVWGTDLVLKAKTTLISVEGPRKIGIGLAVATSFDLVAHQNTGTLVNVPISIQLTEQLRANLNAGWSFDNTTDTHYATWGVGLEWNFVKPLTLIAEIYGIAGDRPPTDPPSLTDVRAQAGLRWTPHDKIDFDLIYGRNIGGENADWITAGVNLRF